MIVVGDIHGSYKALQKLLKQFPSDPICLVGDLVDRGPSSVDVVQFVMDNHDRIKCVKGNHEKMMIDFYEEGGRPRMWDVWLQNGGKKVYEAYRYKHGSQKLITHLDFLKSLPYYLEFPDLKDEDGRYLLVSHSIATSPDLEKCVATEAIIWGRRFPEEDISQGKWFNVFGHTPVKQPILTDYWCNIDTGCCFHGQKFNDGPFKGMLTALRWPELEVTQIENVDVGPTKEREPSPDQGPGYAG